MNKVNEWIVAAAASDAERAEGDNGGDHRDDDDTDGSPPASWDDLKPSDSPADETGSAEAPKPNQGKLLLDATCAPADIAYPTDLSLLNEAAGET